MEIFEECDILIFLIKFYCGYFLHVCDPEQTRAVEGSGQVKVMM